MASASASSIQKSFKYEVFLSFRGEDTRKNFVDHLYHALDQRGIITYKDDIRIEKGEKISDQLITSIQDSRFHILVFSKNYASSSWCLEELVKIMECQKTNEQTAFPLFYDVEPTEVRNQSGPVGEAFAKLEKKEATGRWRDALKQAADLAGWELKNTGDGHEVQFIQKVVEDILRRTNFTSFNFNKKFVGMKTRVESVLSSLEVGYDDVRMIGIKGMGGGGKTTLARVVFDHISCRFEGKCFVENVREGSEGSGLKKLQKQVLRDVFNDQSIRVSSVSDGIHKMEKMMPSRRVLLILDDVDHLSQLKALAGEPTWFKAGSRIIITTRDKHLLVAHGLKSNNIHDASLLTEDEAICLLSRYAFQKEVPDQGYEQLSRKIVHYAAGLPLTITVLGSDLFGRTKHEWEDTIKSLETIPEEETLARLELSYIGLKNDQKEIFLEVACILKGKRKDEAKKILESCGYHAEIGLKVLEEKSLINISSYDELILHDLIEEMGMNIVRRSHPDEPERHSLLWIKEEIENILVNDLGTVTTRSIKLANSTLQPSIIMKGLRKMTGLRFLYVHSSGVASRFDEVSGYLPYSLRYLCWGNYPFWCLPKNFQANNLVTLDVSYNSLSQLWEGGERKVLNTLRFLKLSGSMLKTFDLEMTPNLKELDLHNCTDLKELHMPVACPALTYLNLMGSSLKKLNLGLAQNLEELYLEVCANFEELNMSFELPQLKILKLCKSKLHNLNLVMAPNLKELYLEGCEDFEELNMPDVCPELTSLNLRGTGLKKLNLGLAPNLKELDLDRCYELVELQLPVECPKLRSINPSYSSLRNLNLGLAPNLETIYLEGCKDLVELNIPIELPKLKYLLLSSSKLRNLNLGLIPNLKKLDITDIELTELHLPDVCPKLTSLDLSCPSLKNLNLGLAPNLKTLYLEGCKGLVELNISTELPELKLLLLSSSMLRNLNLGVTPNLKWLHLENCSELEELNIPIECSQLKVLRLSGFQVSALRPGLTPLLEKSESLEELSLHIRDIKRLPDGIWMSKNLKLLSLSSCWLLDQLPKDLGRAECLEKLDLRDCISLQDIPNSICNMKHLRRLDLSHCFLVEKLPEEFRRLESLRWLNIEGAGIKYLPRRIFQLKSLEIRGHRWRLESYGFTSLINDPYGDRHLSYYYI